MRAVVLCALFLFGINALPEIDPQLVNDRQERFVTDQIIEEIDNLKEGIRDMGLDPLLIEHDTYKFELPVPVIFNAAAEVQDVRSFGLSNIVVELMNYSVLLFRLDFHLAMPHIHLFARRAKGEVTFFGKKLTVEGDGSVDIRRIDVVGRANVRLGIISGISISSLTIDFKIGQIASNIRLAIQGRNHSERINKLISRTIPATLDEFSDEINELLEIILIDIINDNL